MAEPPLAGRGSKARLSSSRRARKEEQIYGIFAEDEETSNSFLLASSDEDDGYKKGRGAIQFVKGGVWTPTPADASGSKKRQVSEPTKKREKKIRDAKSESSEEADASLSLQDQLLNAQVLKEVLGDAYESSEEEEKADLDEEKEKASAKSAEENDETQDSPAETSEEDGDSSRTAKRRKLGESREEASDASESEGESDDEESDRSRFKFSGAQNVKADAKAGDSGPVAVEKNTWGFAKMEKTYGVGFKLLQKMGFKGGGLGRHGTGVANPLEVRVREKNRGLQDSGEKVGRMSKGKALTALDILLGKKFEKNEEGVSEEWKKNRKALTPSERRRRRLAQTAAEVAAEGRLQVQRAREKLQASSVRILDMTGPDVRVIQGKDELRETLLHHKRVADGAAAGAEDEEFVLQGLAGADGGETRLSGRVARAAPLRSLQIRLRHVIGGVEEELRQVVREKKEQEAVLLQWADRGDNADGADDREDDLWADANADKGVGFAENAVLESLRSAKEMVKRVERIDEELRKLWEEFACDSESRRPGNQEEHSGDRRRKEEESGRRRRDDESDRRRRDDESDRRRRDDESDRRRRDDESDRRRRDDERGRKRKEEEGDRRRKEEEGDRRRKEEEGDRRRKEEEGDRRRKEEEGDRRRKEEEGDRRRKEEEGDRRRRDDEREEKKRERGRSGSRGENGWERRGRSEEASEEKSLSSERERRDETRASAPSKREQWSNDERSRSRSKARGGGSRGASQSPQRRGTSLSEKSSSDSDPFGIDAVLDLATALHDKYPFEFRVLHVPSLLTALLRPRLQCALRSWRPLASSSSSSPSSSSSSASSCPHAPASAASETGCDSDVSSRLPTAVGRLVARFSALAQQEALEVHACYRMLARLEGRADGSSKAFSESASAERDGCTQSWLAPLLAGRMEGRELQRQTQERVTCRLTFDSQTAALRLLRLPLRASAQPYLLSMHALEHVLRVTVLEALRAALVNDWSPDDGEGARLQAEGSAASGKAAGASAGDRGAEPLAAAPSGGDSGVCVVTLVERWLGALPPETARFLIEDVVLQKLLQAVDEWNPVKAKTPIHTWLHPWLPHLSPHHLQLLSSPLRLKIGLALDAKWKATDRSAVNLLLPWATVFDAYSFAALLQRSVMPKLHDHLLNLPIRPDNQHMQPLHDVLVWVPLLPVEMLVNLFLTAFFPRWLQVLKVWINSTHADFSEILEWYSGWKEILPQALVTHARVQGVFVEALQLMNYASATLGLPVIPQPPSTSQAPQPPSPVSAFPHPPSHAAQMGPFPPPGAAPPAPGAATAGAGAAYYLGQGVSGLSSGAQLAPEPVAPGPTAVSGDGTTPAPPGTISSLEYLEGLAKEKGILFKPKVGRIEEGRQVYAYGRMNMYVKDKVIYVKGKAILKWTPVDIDDLLKLAKGEKTSISGSAYSRKGR